MKFIHTADWHLGKLVHGIQMTEDQSYMLKQFLHVVLEEKPDAVVIAGDLYDRSVPPTNAVELLHDILYKITTEYNIPVLAISGNHDSAERIHFGNQLFRKSQLFIEGKPIKKPKPVEVNGVNFYLIPYSEPSTIRYLYDDQSITSHEAALKRVIGTIEDTLITDRSNVFIGHAFVIGGQQSDSERSLSVGGTGAVASELFAPFQYTALGHLHNRNAIQHNTVHYSGSLMKYSFSEVNHTKSVSIVTIKDNGEHEIKYRSLVPRIDMRELSGTLDELLDPAYYQKQKVDDYLKINLHDKGALIDPIGKLRAVYPNVLHLERKIEIDDAKRSKAYDVRTNKQVPTIELFKDFYQEMTTNDFSDEKKSLVTEVIDSLESEKRGHCK